MKFLSKLGRIILEGIKLWTGFSGALGIPGGIVTKVTDTLTRIADIIVAVEVAGQALNLPGDQKLTAAVPLVMQALLKADFMLGNKVKNDALALAGARKMADGMADFLNSLDDDKIDTEDKA